MRPDRPDVLIVSHDVSSNGLGRAHVLWMLARAAGMTAAVVGPSSRGEVWTPLRDSEFASACDVVESPRELRSRLRTLGDDTVLVAVKALPETYGALVDEQRPLLLDIDDPDTAARQRRLRIRSWVRRPRTSWAVRRRNLALRQLESRIDDAVRTVSNPVLQDRHGGRLVPHVRLPRAAGQPHERHDATVAFVGTVRPHKGVDVLRAAVQRAMTVVDLTITAPLPVDPMPGERWIGEVTMAEGMRIVDEADVVAVPSLDRPWTDGQFPVKLLDAMMSGRAIVASDNPVIRWVLGDAGLLVPPGDVEALAAALRTLRDPDRRQSLGDAARSRVLERFTPDAVAEEFAAALADARQRAHR